MNTATEIRRFRADIANRQSILRELERKDTSTSRAEGERQRQLIAGLEANPEDIQLSARLFWLNRVYSKATLPFMKSQFDMNLLVDVAATWEPGGGSVHPETRISLEFEPEEFNDANLAFALTWTEGQFSPTFEDEDAFLAGLKLRF